MKLLSLLFLSAAALFLVSCAEEASKKPVGPVSSKSPLPWGRPQPGEGGAAFGGALDQR